MGLGASSQFVFQMVNLAGIIYTTSGAVAKPAFSLEDFWFAEPTRMSDPQVLYDAQGGRWFASILVLPNHVRFAVSANSDPTGIWYIYQVSAFGPGPVNLPDQPFIGYSNDKFLISTNNFSCDPTLTICAFFSVEIWVFNKAQMMAGAFAPAFNAFFNPGGLFFRVDPMQQLTPGNDAFLVWNCESITTNVCPITPPTGGITVFTFSGPPPPTLVFPSIVTVPIALTGTPNNADQPGTTTKLNTNDERIISAVWSNNRIWTALNDGPFLKGGQCPVASCVRLDQIATPTTPASTLQDFDFYSNGAAAFYGAVSTDSSNNLVAMFETSSSTVFPSLLVTAQLATMTPQTLAPSSTVKSGSAVDLTGRWGDYYYATTQPGASSTFWISGGYRTITLFQGWQTRIGQITFAAAGGPPPPPPPPCPESDGNGNFQGQNGQGNFAFDNDKCEDGDTNIVSSSNRGDGQSFQSTQITSTQFDQATHATSITGIGVSNGVVVGFTLVALESSLTTPGWVSFSFSDGYTNAGYLTSGTILLH
jgi:hypothetical protein